MRAPRRLVKFAFPRPFLDSVYRKRVPPADPMVAAKSAVAGAVVALVLGRDASASALEIPLAGAAIEAEGKVEFLGVGRFRYENPNQEPQGRIRLRVGSKIGSHLRLQTGVTGSRRHAARARRRRRLRFQPHASRPLAEPRDR